MDQRRWSPRKIQSGGNGASHKIAASHNAAAPPPPVVYQPAPVIVKGPRHVAHAPHPVHVRNRHGRGYWADRYIPDR